MDNACDIEFQRVHRIREKRPNSPRPIIARFLRFPDREKVFRRALQLKDKIEATGWDGISLKILKLTGKGIAPSLTRLFNN